MTRIFVGNLPVSTTDASLGALFAARGKVESAAVIIDRETGRTLKIREDEDREAQGGERRGSSRLH